MLAYAQSVGEQNGKDRREIRAKYSDLGLSGVHMFRTTRGLVLREVKYKEADRIITVLTYDMGKLSAKARGALRKGSKLSAATQSLVFSELTMFENRGKWSVNEGSTLEEFKGLRSSLSALSLASYIAECTEALTGEGQEEPQILRLALNCLFALSNEMYPQEHIKAAFELRLMCLAGYEPDISACAVCGRTEDGEMFFLPADGCICCSDCRKVHGGSAFRISDAALCAMRYILTAEPKRLLSFSLPPDSANELYAIAEAYLLEQTERRFSTLDYWKKVK